MLVVKLSQLLSRQCVRTAEEMMLWLHLSICSFSLCLALSLSYSLALHSKTIIRYQSSPLSFITLECSYSLSHSLTVPPLTFLWSLAQFNNLPLLFSNSLWQIARVLNTFWKMSLGVPHFLSVPDSTSLLFLYLIHWTWKLALWYIALKQYNKQVCT